MALDAATSDEYFRLAQQQQVLFAYWLDAGVPSRARLALDVANWYYQQLGLGYFIPTNLAGYAPNPTTPDAALALAASLPTEPDPAAPATALSPRDVGGSFTSNFIDPMNDYCSAFPTDPACWNSFSGGGSDDGGGNFPAPISVFVEPVTVIINQNGLTLADVASRISGALSTAAVAIATAVDSVVATAIRGIQAALNAIGNELMSVFHLLSRLAGYILQFLKGLLLDVVHGIVAALSAIGRMLKDVFAHGIMPALQALQKLRNYLMQIYQRFLRPLLVVIQDIRKVLAILRAFHVGFATKLDNALADIQSKISTPLLYLLRYTNAIANYINLILDARLLLQKPLFLASLNAYKGSSINLLINSMNPTPDPAAIAALQASTPQLTPAQATDQMNQLLQSNSGPLAAPVAQQVTAFQSYIGQGQ